MTANSFVVHVLWEGKTDAIVFVEPIAPIDSTIDYENLFEEAWKKSEPKASNIHKGDHGTVAVIDTIQEDYPGIFDIIFIETLTVDLT